MKAARLHEYHSPLVIEEVPQPPVSALGGRVFHGHRFGVRVRDEPAGGIDRSGVADPHPQQLLDGHAGTVTTCTARTSGSP